MGIRLDADEDEIPDAVPESFASCLKLGAGALAERIAHDRREALRMQVSERRFAAEHFEHLFGVVFPVRGAVDIGARPQAGGQQRDDFRTNQATLVMTGLSPGIGEVDVNAGERIGRDHVAHDFHGVMAHETNVGQAHFLNALAEGAHAGDEDLAAEKVHFGVRLRDGRRRFSHAAADFEHKRRAAAEGSLRIERFEFVFDFVLREDLFDGSLLSDRDMPAA